MAKKQKGKGFAISGHKRFSASNSKRWINCSGCVALVESLPLNEQTSGDNVHSRRGTTTHAVGEMCLVAYNNDRFTTTVPEDYLGMEVEGVLVDQDIVNGATVYVDWASDVIDEADFVSIEESLSLEKYITNIQAETGEFMGITGAEHGGTGDLVAGKRYGWLRVVDYKNGYGLVEADDNTQMLEYALMSLLEYDEEYDFTEVIMTIVQPNAQHPEGSIRHWTVTPEYVFEWALEVLLPAAQRCIDAVKALKRRDPDFVEVYLKADESWCNYCPARSRCKAAMNQATDNAIIEFTEELSELDWETGGTDLALRLPNVALITPEHEALILEHGNAIIGLVQAVQQRAHQRAEAGNHVEGWKLVNKTAHRRFKSPEQKIKDDLKRMGLHPHDYMGVPELKTISQLEKVFKSKGLSKEAVVKFNERHVEKPDIGTSLVPATDKRPAVKAAIDAEFAHLFDLDDDAFDLE